jgi:RND family efflux transporter MFP subunit
MTRRNLNNVLAAGLLASLVACSKPADSGKPAAATSSKPRPVRAAAAEVRPMERAVTVTGLLLADEDATLSVKIGGRLRSLTVDLGSVVKRGDVIAQVEPRDYELRLQQAAAALAQARATVGLSLEGADDTFVPEKTSAVKEARAVLDEATRNRDRVLKLSEQGVLSKSEFDTVEAAYKIAVNRLESAREEASTRQAVLAQRRAEFDLAKQQLADTSLRSPFDGSIQSRLANVGEFLPAGSPVVKLVKIDPLRLRLDVPERDAAAVRLSQPVRLAVEGDTNHYTGTLTRVSPAIDEQTRMLVVEADVHNDGTLRPGLFARAQIITRTDDSGLAVPISSLVVFAGLEKVIIVQEGKAVERIVETGRRSRDWVEIRSGLDAGDLVVLEPGNLRTGEAVTVTEAPVARPSLSSSNQPDANAR